MFRSLPCLLPLLAAFATLACGCNRNDAERLGRIGTKVSAHAKANSSAIGAKVDLSWPRPELTLHEKIHDRLRFDKALGDVTIEVHVKEKEIELKGIVKDAAQKQRAMELAESVAGVEKVADAMTIRETDETKKPNDEEPRTK